jgi:hypothetical protein
MIKGTIVQKLSRFCLLIPLSIALSGMAVFVYQICFWATRGHWKPLGSRVILDIILPTSFLRWVENPGSWLILKKIMSVFLNYPLSLCMMVLGLAVLLFAVKVFDLSSKTEKNNPRLQEDLNPLLASRHYPGLLKILSSQNGHKN